MKNRVVRNRQTWANWMASSKEATLTQKHTQYIRIASDTDVRTTHSGHVFATECESESFVGSLALADVVLCACVWLVPSLSVQRDAPFERHASRVVWVRLSMTNCGFRREQVIHHTVSTTKKQHADGAFGRNVAAAEAQRDLYEMMLRFHVSTQ